MEIKFYILIGLIAATFIGLGRVLEKKGLSNVSSLGEGWIVWEEGIRWGKITRDLEKFLNSYFLIGVGFDFSGWILTLKALSIGNISIVQPLKAFTNLVAVLLGVIWLGERLDKEEYLGIFLIILGIIFINLVA